MVKTFPTCSCDRLVPHRCDMETRNEPPDKPASFSRSKNRFNPRLPASVTPWLFPPVTLPAMSVTRVKLGVKPRSSSFGRKPSQSPNRSEEHTSELQSHS